MTLWVCVAIAAASLAAVHAFNLLRLERLRRSGLYPKRGQGTIADVKRLMNDGATALAVRCYREIHSCSLREASEAVRTLPTER